MQSVSKPERSNRTHINIWVMWDARIQININDRHYGSATPTSFKRLLNVIKPITESWMHDVDPGDAFYFYRVRRQA